MRAGEANRDDPATWTRWPRAGARPRERGGHRRSSPSSCPSPAAAFSRGPYSTDHFIFEPPPLNEQLVDPVVRDPRGQGAYPHPRGRLLEQPLIRRHHALDSEGKHATDRRDVLVDRVLKGTEILVPALAAPIFPFLPAGLALSLAPPPSSSDASREALDVMEPARPGTDALLLDLLTSRTFRPRSCPCCTCTACRAPTSCRL